MAATVEFSKANAAGRKTPLEHTRNMGIAAHIDAGKTTTTERILFYAGVIHKMGEVHEGNTTTDWMEQERERGITITSAAVSCNWTTKEGIFSGINHHINLIDTPGHVDFTAEVERSMRVLDGAIATFCAVAGVQPQSETVWRQMTKYNVPRIAYINKMDRTGANFLGAVKGIRERLGGNAHPIYLPMGAEDKFIGLIDLVKMKALVYDTKDVSGVRFVEQEIPAEYTAEANDYRAKLIEAIADHDDAIMEKYLSGDTFTFEEVMRGVRKAIMSMNFVPVIPGSSFKNKGVQMLMDAIVNYLPGPLDVEPIKATDESEQEVKVIADDNAKAAALVFKIWSNPFFGRLTFIRTYRGIVRKGDALYNPRTRKTERISRLAVIKADQLQDIDAAYSGDICAIIGAKDVRTGDTLCPDDAEIRLEPPTFADPVISMSIEPSSKADQEKMGNSLGQLMAEDPTFRVSTNAETGQTIIAGMGELHLEIIADRLKREFKVQATTGKPQIAYRETITKSGEGVGKFIRQSGGRGQYGHAVVTIEPNEKGKGIEITDETVGGVIPKEYIKPTIEGINEASQNGTVAGYPVIDVKVKIIDGSYHDVDSNELAFKMAGIFAFKEAMKVSAPILLEPIMKVQVETPAEYQGDVIGDLNRRRGQIMDVDIKPTYVAINANVPLETMFGYSTDVRSISKGRATYTMEPSHFEQVPANLLTKIVESSSRAPARS
jgi:elongation factor G